MPERRFQAAIRRRGDWGELVSDINVVISSNVGDQRRCPAEEEARREVSEGGSEETGRETTPEREEGTQ
jgi:hypothetical protein